MDWWKQKHPRLANVAASAIRITDAARSDSSENTVYPRIAKATKGEIEEAGLHCRVTRFTCECHIETAEYDEEEIRLSMDFLTTDARTRTYTWQTGSESVDGETLPDGLAQALYEQRAGALASEQMTVRLGNSLPVIGDMADGLILQSYDIDLADLTARLVFGRPEHLSAEDMRSLLNGFRQRGYASTSRIRKEEADEDADEADAPGGIPPINSSEWAPGTTAKTTIKKAGANAGGVGAIKLDAASVPQGKTVEVKTLTLKGAGSGGADKTLKVLATEDMEIDPSGGGGSSDTEDVVTGISFAFDNSTNQLKATLTKKRVTVSKSESISGTAPTATLPLWKQDVDSSSAYSPSTHSFTKVIVPGVRTEETAPSTPSNVFTATPHSAEMDSGEG